VAHPGRELAGSSNPHRGVEEELPFDTSAEAPRGLRLLNLTTQFGDLDSSFETSGTGGYPDLSKHAAERETAGRDKDVRKLVELHALL
jgi:hypothetical protein